jgi:SAM-dependent methyltransferase
MQRIVAPEILDSLASDDPEAVRSRADLKFINWMMAGEAWIIRELQKIEQIECVVELGAGAGALANKIKKAMPHVRIVAVDLIAAPEALTEGVEWIQSDVLDYDGITTKGTVVVANLFLHHLDNNALSLLNDRCKNAEMILISEPYRSRVSLFFARLIYPFMGRVTRHDMIVSIYAGFRRGDAKILLANNFEWSESLGLFGGIRCKGQ